jgi:hypothetical protein
MPVFREKNGICEGANPRYGPAGTHHAPAGFAFTSCFFLVRKTRLETYSSKLPIGKDLCLRIMVRFITPYLLKKGGNNENTN